MFPSSLLWMLCFKASRQLRTMQSLQGNHLLLPAGRQVFTHFQENRTHHVKQFLGKTNAITLNTHTILLFLNLDFIVQHDVVWYGIFFWLVRPAVIALSSPLSLWPLSLLSSRAVSEVLGFWKFGRAVQQKAKHPSVINIV